MKIPVVDPSQSAQTCLPSQHSLPRRRGAPQRLGPRCAAATERTVPSSRPRPSATTTTTTVSLSGVLIRDGGPPRISSPLPDAPDPTTDRAARPLMLYLPGIDGTGEEPCYTFKTKLQ